VADREGYRRTGRALGQPEKLEIRFGKASADRTTAEV
jgi:hypothetical protein